MEIVRSMVQKPVMMAQTVILMMDVMTSVKLPRQGCVVHKIVQLSMILIIQEICSPVVHLVCVVEEIFHDLPTILAHIVGHGLVLVPMVLLMITVAQPKSTVVIVSRRLDKVNNVMMVQMEMIMMGVMIYVKLPKSVCVVASVAQQSMILRIVEIVLIVAVRTFALLV